MRLRGLLPFTMGAALLAQPPATVLVQSVPAETSLADPDLPFAKDVWVDMLRGARRSIDLAEFYVTSRPGSALEPVLAELEKAGARGVKLRLLLSNKMLDQDPASVARLRRIPGAELRALDLGAITKGILHAKYFVVDGREAFLGSQNFDWRALEHIHELGLRTSDPRLVEGLADLFEVDWDVAVTRRPPLFSTLVPQEGTASVALVASPRALTPPRLGDELEALVALIREAKASVRVQLLVYSPLAGKDQYWPVLDDALRAAAVRGVKVQLLLSDWVLGGRAMPHLKALTLIPNLEVRVASIPEAKEGHIPYARTIHSKYLVVDGRHLALSTSNWEEGYFTESRNVAAILRDSPLAAQAARIHQRLWTSLYTFPLDVAKSYERRKVD